MTDNAVQEVGGIVLPLPTQGSNTLLRDADPALFYSLDFYGAMVTQYCGARIVQAASSFTQPITNAVAGLFPWDPAPYLQELQAHLPLLAVYRTRSKLTWKTIGWESDHCSFRVEYILPPLTAGQHEQVGVVLRAIVATLRKLTRQGFDPSYTPPGGNLGDIVWGQGQRYALIEQIELKEDTYAGYQNAGNLYMPAVAIDGEWWERDMYPPAGLANRDKFAGADVTVNAVASDGTSIPSFIQASTQQAPTITMIGPGSGTQAGGTSITITGNLFLTGASVLFGVNKATNVVVNSPNNITCTTPAASGGGAVNVIVANRDGQLSAFGNGFTYTTP